MEDWVTIKTLKKKNPTKSLRSIALAMRISHHTVQRALSRDDPPTYERKRKENPSLEPFRDVIAEMVNAKRFRGSRILRELRAKGYTGGKTAFYRFLAQVRIEKKKHFTPYATAPGEQSQFDWSIYTIPLGGVETKVVVYSYINGFSRYPVYDAAVHQDQDTVYYALETGLIESGGVPERIQTDNAKVFVIDASSDSFRWNPEYLRFCAHYGVLPTRSLPRHPWSKGKVEKTFQYLEDHFITGGSFSDFSDFLAKLKTFQHHAATRLHASIKTTPEALLPEDQAAFSPLPKTRFQGGRSTIRTVSREGLFSFSGSRYSVPRQYSETVIWLRVLRGYTVEVYSQTNSRIASHLLSTVKGALVIDKSHFRSCETPQYTLDLLKLRFRECFPGQELFLEKLLAQKRTNARSHLAGILDVVQHYHIDDVSRAFQTAISYNIFTCAFIAGFLEKNSHHVFDPPPVPHMTCEGFNATPIIRRLSDYQIRESR